MKKTTTIIVIILIIIMYAQLVYYTHKNTDNNTVEEVTQYTNTTSNTVKENKVIVNNSDEGNKKVIPTNLSEFYKSYLGIVSISSLENKLYNFLYIDTPKIIELTNGKSGDEISTIYNDNMQELNEMYLYSAEDLLNITNQLNQIKYTGKYEYSSSELDISSIEKDDEYTVIKLTVKYTNEHAFMISLYLANDDSMSTKFEIKNYSPLDTLYKKYNGMVKKADVEKSINYFITTSASAIHDATDEKTKNQILQYFDLNKDNISEMNIYTADDYYKIYTQIVKLSWKKNPEFMYYTINMDTYSKQGNYDTIQLTLNYSNSQSMVLKLYLTNTSLQDQSIKFTA